MPLKYRIVLKKDMSKGAAKGDQLYYGQIRSLEKTNFKNCVNWYPVTALPNPAKWNWLSTV